MFPGATRFVATWLTAVVRRRFRLMTAVVVVGFRALAAGLGG